MEENQTQIILINLNDINVDIREEAAIKLSKIANGIALDGLLKRFVIEENPNVKKMIIYALGEIASDKAISILNEYSKSEDVEMRWVVAEALGNFSTHQASEILINCLKNEKESVVRVAIIKSLGNFDSMEAIQAILSYLINDEENEDYSVIKEALWILNNLNNDTIVDIIIKTISTKYVNNINNNFPKLLIDANLLIDYLLERNYIFFDGAKKIINLIIFKELNGYITELGLQKVYDIIKRIKGKEHANHLIIKISRLFNICKVDNKIIEKVCEYSLISFETGIQIECAKDNQLDAIITLKPKEFLACGWENIFHPSHFLDSYLDDKEIYSTVKSCQDKLNQSLLNYADKEELLFEDKLFLFKGWKIEYFDILCSKNNLATANVVLLNTNKNNLVRYSESAFGTGISTLFSALDKAIHHIDIQPKHTFDSINIYNLEKGINSSVCVVVAVKFENYKMRKTYTHRNIVKACFYAYVLALKGIYNSDENHMDKELFAETNFLCTNQMINNIYEIGERDFSQSNWRGINLANQKLSEVNLTNSNLSGANLSGADLTGANLSGADLTGANLSGADLTNIIINKVNLSKANLSECDLRNLDLNKTVLCDNNIITNNTKMPEITIPISEAKRNEIIIQLFNQIDYTNYVISAVHGIHLDTWYNSDVGKEFRRINKVLSDKGIPIKRVFILPEDNSSIVVNEIIEEQKSHGIEVLSLTEKLAKINDFDFIKRNLLVCRNTLVAENSFTTEMIFDGDKQKEDGYISYKTDDIKTNEQRFSLIWESAKYYSNNCASY